ncbi:transposable element Tcb2 transposase [Trichonephila clavipes]|nr:transposable element Tcb2 transposase [Trichonephila clavipes]
MVLAGIMINGRTRLHVVANGTMTGQRYIDEVLLSHVRLFRGAVGDKFVFMDDNATCHRTLAVQDCLDSKDALGRQVAGRNFPPTNKNTLIRAFTEKWDKYPQQLLDNVVQSSGLNNHDVQEFGFNKMTATCHTARDQRFQIVGTRWDDRQMSRFGTHHWLPRSCDLTPFLDYFLWG